MTAGTDPRVGLAALLFGLGASISYVAQRLASYLGGEVLASTVLASEHTPFFWRVGLAVFQGLILAVIVGVAVPEDAARRWLSRLTAAVLPVVAVLIGLTFVVP
ncbi:MAG: hypothetical protein KDA24_24875 [Deltaproteobacteria bacterium]|nr:hypothetical protein [Deltaproteobacteria bacterium]